MLLPKEDERALAPSFGVELWLPLEELDREGARRLLHLLRQRKLILIKRQTLNEEAYVRVGHSLGEVWRVDAELAGNSEACHAVSGYVEIARVSNMGGLLSNRAVDWHGDLAHHPVHPHPGRILYAKTMASDATSVTSWVDLEYGWTHLLDDADRARVRNLEGEFKAGYKTAWSSARHPLVRRRRADGREWIAIDRAFFRSFLGMDRAASAQLKRRLLGKLICGPSIYRHAWEPGDVIIYDNEGTMHRRERIFGSDERTIWRLTLEYAWH
jgi:taurine dioxygenase